MNMIFFILNLKHFFFHQPNVLFKHIYNLDKIDTV